MGYYSTKNSGGSLHLLDRKPETDQRGRQSRAIIPDEVVLDIRHKHEIDRLTTNQVFAAFPQYSKHYLKAIMGYTLRAHLTLKK